MTKLGPAQAHSASPSVSVSEVASMQPPATVPPPHTLAYRLRHPMAQDSGSGSGLLRDSSSASEPSVHVSIVTIHILSLMDPTNTDTNLTLLYTRVATKIL